MKLLLLPVLFTGLLQVAAAQEKIDPWLEQLVRGQASPFLLGVLE